jgi:N-methylhydantoinase B
VAALFVNPGTQGERILSPQDGNIRLRPGDILRREQPGSGGYGDPHRRPAERVLHDVQEGYVSPESAREHYGVAVVAVVEVGGGRGWMLDEAETAQLRRSDAT